MIRTIGFPKAIQEEIIKYLYKPVEYGLLTDEDAKDIIDILNNYECMIRFRDKDYEIIRYCLDENELSIGFRVNHISYEFMYHPTGSECSECIVKRYIDRQYYRRISGFRYKGDGKFVAGWFKIKDIPNNNLTLMIGKRKISLWRRFINFFKYY